MASLGTWAHRIALQVSNSNIDANQTHFPLPIEISSSSGITNVDATPVFDHLRCDENRLRIAVTKSDGTTQINVIVVEWDDANEYAMLLVSKSDLTFSSSETTTLYLYYDRQQPSNTTYVKDATGYASATVFSSAMECAYSGIQESITTSDRTDMSGMNLWLYNNRAEYYNGRTYFTWLDYTNADIEISFYDHALGLWADPVKIANAFASNAHHSPTLCVNEDGHICVFTGDNDESDDVIYMYRSTYPEIITNWGSAVTVASPSKAQYPNTFLHSDGTLVMLYRAEETYAEVHRILSTDNGATWSNDQTIYQDTADSAEKAYFDYWFDENGRLHFAWSYRSTSGDSQDLYYAYCDNITDATSAWKTANGTSITLPMDSTTAAYRIYDSSGDGWDHCYIVGVVADGNKPYIFAKLTDSGTTNEIICMYYSSGWSTTTVVATNDLGTPSGSDVADGDCYIDGDGYVYVCFTIDESSTDEIDEYYSTNGGSSFSKKRDVTSSSSGNCYCPCYPHNLLDDDSCRMIWFVGAALNTDGDIHYWGGSDKDPQEAAASPTYIIDSTSNDRNVLVGANTPDVATGGNPGSYENFDGSEYMDLSSEVSDITSDAEGGFSCRFRTSYTSANQTILCISDASDADSRLKIFIQNSTGYLKAWLSENGTKSWSLQQDTDYADGNWHTLGLSVDSNGLRVLVDGSALSPSFAQGSASSTEWVHDINDVDAWIIGAEKVSDAIGQQFNGDLDEIRYYSDAPSSAWFKMEHHGHTDNLITWGTDESIKYGTIAVSAGASLAAQQSRIRWAIESIGATSSLSALADLFTLASASLSVTVNGPVSTSSIDAGAAASNRASELTYGYTLLDKTNPADGNGTITSVEIWANTNLGGCKVGTFYEDGGSGKYTCRDSASIGSVTSGSKQTFSGLSIDVQTGDLIGIYYSSGTLERDGTGGDAWQYSGDAFGTSQATYSDKAYILSVYATGEAPGSGIDASAIMAGGGSIGAAASLSITPTAVTQAIAAIAAVAAVAASGETNTYASVAIAIASSLGIDGDALFDAAASIGSTLSAAVDGDLVAGGAAGIDIAASIASDVDRIRGAVASIDGAASLAVDGSAILAAIAAIEAASSLSLSGDISGVKFAVAAIAVAASLGADSQAIKDAIAAMQAVASVSSAGGAVRDGETSVSGSASMSLESEVIRAAVAAIQVGMSLSSDADAIRSAISAIAVLAALSASGALSGIQSGVVAIAVAASLGLDAEAIKDAIVSISGSLNITATGANQIFAALAIAIVAAMSSASVIVKNGVVTITAANAIEASALSYLARLFAYTGTLTSGDRLIINMDDQTITLNGVNVTRYVSGHFWKLFPGSNTVQYSDDDGSRSIAVDVEHKPRWL